MSNHWFDRFKSRYDISLQHPTNAAQKQSETLRTSIQQFHRYLRRMATVKATELKGAQEGNVGPWELYDIANVDQTPLQNSTHAEKAEKSLWPPTTGELPTFADGEPCIKPLMIFKGTGQTSRQRKETVRSKSRGQVPRQCVLQRGNDGLLAQKYVEEAKHVWSTLQ